MGLDDWWQTAGDLVAGAACHGCGRAGTGCCAMCVAALAEPVRPVSRPGIGLPPTFAAGAHAGPRRRLVIACKDEAAWTLLPLLGDELARAVGASVLAVGEPQVTLVPVPSAPAAVRRRGLDVTRALARRAAARLADLGVEVAVTSALAQRAGARDQVGLGQAGRFANLRSRLRCVQDVAGPVVLVDDIVTTGASLAEGAACLTRAGSQVVACATVSARGWR